MVAEKPVRLLLLAGGAAAVAFLAWHFFGPEGKEPEKKTPEEARGELAKSDAPPETRAEAAAQLGAMRDRQSVPQLIAALEDDDLHVRARANAAVIQILGADFMFRADDPPERRRQAVERIKKHWEAWLAKEPLP